MKLRRGRHRDEQTHTRTHSMRITRHRLVRLRDVQMLTRRLGKRGTKHNLVRRPDAQIPTLKPGKMNSRPRWVPRRDDLKRSGIRIRPKKMSARPRAAHLLGDFLASNSLMRAVLYTLITPSLDIRSLRKLVPDQRNHPVSVLESDPPTPPLPQFTLSIYSIILTNHAQPRSFPKHPTSDTSLLTTATSPSNTGANSHSL